MSPCLKKKYPSFGAAQLSALLEGRVPPERQRGFLSGGPQRPPAPIKRSIRLSVAAATSLANGLQRNATSQAHLRSHSPFLDDASRFAIELRAIANQQFEQLVGTVLGAFEVYGLPALRSRNGRLFVANAKWRKQAGSEAPYWSDVNSGTPYNPRHKDKVERFHGTIDRTLGQDLWQPSIDGGQIGLRVRISTTGRDPTNLPVKGCRALCTNRPSVKDPSTPRT